VNKPAKSGDFLCLSVTTLCSPMDGSCMSLARLLCCFLLVPFALLLTHASAQEMGPQLARQILLPLLAKSDWQSSSFWRQTGRSRDAKELLKPLCEAFPATCALAPLIDARVLLEQA
jgi:hypothetical protein